MGMKETASRLIAKHGQAATLLRPGPWIDDGFGMVPGPDEPYPVTLVMASLTIEQKYIAAGFQGVGGQRVLVSTEGLTITPKTSDKIEVQGTALGIVSVTPLAPGGEVYFWEITAEDIAE